METLPVRGFREECELLAPLESFDPAAFRGTSDVPQELCNFVLAIALIYNDCKDVIYAHVALNALQPKDPYERTRFRGAFAGVQLHAFRAVAGLVHELFELIRANSELLQHPFLVSVVQQLHQKNREAWDALVNVAGGATPTDRLGKTLLLLRNKVFFHYDPKAIVQGYRSHFLDAKRDDRAYISRGDSMRATRFYFADAAARGYLSLVAAPGEIEELMQTIAGIMDQLNRGLMTLVVAFIQRRAYPFRPQGEA